MDSLQDASQPLPATDSIIRNAEPDDAPALAQILSEAFPALYHGTFGGLRSQEVVALLTALYNAGHLSLTDTRVCERNGEIIGIMILHTGESIGRGTIGDYWDLLRRTLGPVRAIRACLGGVTANYMLDRRIPRGPDLVYIEALAVKEAFRGRGVGSTLLTEAETWARSRRRTRLALHVLNSNAGARRLYERFGFRTWYSPSAGWHGFWSRPSSWTAILMARPVEK